MPAGQRRRPANSDAPKKPRILVVDDDRDMRDLLRAFLEEEGYTATVASGGQEALDRMSVPEGERPDLILLDHRMPVMQGTEVLERMREEGIAIPAILMTASGSANLTINAMQKGAADYLPVEKPFDLNDVKDAVERVLRSEERKRTAEYTELPTKADPSDKIVGTDPAMIQILKVIGQVARTPMTVLVTGESGTGKELMAEAIHNASRRKGALVKVNCAALPETLLESELFGHEKGSFTGAVGLHKGRFEAAHGGTIFLDEVGEMTLGTQKKLLRVLQEHEFDRVGGTQPIKVDVRVIAATNKNLRDEVLNTRFREDLFFRLNVVPIHMPPLRERRGDIPALVSHFLDKYRYNGATVSRISDRAMERLDHYDWPGNVRELENVLQRAVVLGRGGPITEEQIVFESELNRYILDVEQRLRAGASLEELLTDVRREALIAALRMHGHERARAAEQLKISEAELNDLCAQLGIDHGAPALLTAPVAPAPHTRISAR
ncbi:MAG TPA: sigma-54 dependent transcriptional regulator [Ktedonobacterales bacterium]|nr:sigma-54 dependent transcriptional regulator [Ktedonobacterales bacterium]